MCKYIMESTNKWLDENMCKMLIYQVMIALRYLHSNNCGHLDVKCENILISFLKPLPATSGGKQSTIRHKTDLPLVKLADFGYSRIIGEHSFRKTRVGTVRIVHSSPRSTRVFTSRKSTALRRSTGARRVTTVWSICGAWASCSTPLSQVLCRTMRRTFLAPRRSCAIRGSCTRTCAGGISRTKRST